MVRMVNSFVPSLKSIRVFFFSSFVLSLGGSVALTRLPLARRCVP